MLDHGVVGICKRRARRGDSRLSKTHLRRKSRWLWSGPPSTRYGARSRPAASASPCCCPCASNRSYSAMKKLIDAGHRRSGTTSPGGWPRGSSSGLSGICTAAPMAAPSPGSAVLWWTSCAGPAGASLPRPSRFHVGFPRSRKWRMSPLDVPAGQRRRCPCCRWTICGPNWPVPLTAMTVCALPGPKASSNTRPQPA